MYLSRFIRKFQKRIQHVRQYLFWNSEQITSADDEENIMKKNPRFHVLMRYNE